MAVWAIGDIQGCFEQLQALLKKIDFSSDRDQLWIAGDLVNRGPASLETLRFLYSIRDNCEIVLGNHDLHCLAIAEGSRKLGNKDTLGEVMQADDRPQLLDWLRRQKMLHIDSKLNAVMVHAGIPPIWTLEVAQAMAREVEQALRSEQRKDFFSAMYGDKPEVWDIHSDRFTRLRVICNYLTRMRFCTENGTLDLKDKSSIRSSKKGYLPWFEFPSKDKHQLDVVFGHWAALQGETNVERMHAIDTGCVWGSCLTAMNLADKQRVAVTC